VSHKGGRVKRNSTCQLCAFVTTIAPADLVSTNRLPGGQSRPQLSRLGVERETARRGPVTGAILLPGFMANCSQRTAVSWTVCTSKTGTTGREDYQISGVS
jgi:hypothetical protein